MTNEEKQPESVEDLARETGDSDAASDVANEQNPADTADTGQGGEQGEIARLSGEVEKLRLRTEELKDKWMRCAADYDNFRKRVRKEWELLQLRTKAESVLGVLPVVDDFERAFSVVGDTDDDFIRGIRLIYNKLAAALEEVGVRRIDALGTAFDPARHMAVAHIEREGAEPNQVVEVLEAGYSLGDIVIRPAKVVIAK
jgi:molecular chaperone GrpE